MLGVCAELAQRDLPWHALHVGQLDERAVSASHPERAWPTIEAAFLAHTSAQVGGRYPIPVDHLDAETAAHSYDDTLGNLTASIHRIIAVCGLGEDGHVASLLAGDEHKELNSRVLTTGPYSGLLRVTVSMAFLQTMQNVIVVASGQSKAITMQQLSSFAPDIPAARLPAHTEFVIDRQAAALMEQSPCHD